MAGTASRVVDINLGAGDSYPAFLTVFGNELYFQANDGVRGAELWKMNTAGSASRVADINLGSIGSYPAQLTVFDNALYFSADENGQNSQVWRTGQPDFGDAPDPSDGSGLVNYHTLSGDEGPQHTVTSDVRLGAASDGEDEAWQSALADGDNTHGAADEDGLVDPVADLNWSPQSVPTVRVSVTNTRSVPATLYGWIDYNGNGEFENGTERASVSVPPGTSGAVVTLTFPAAPATAATDVFARFRLSTDPSAQNSTGAAADGEVEDYCVRTSTILVTTVEDEDDGPDAGTGTSLREALAVASSTGGDRIGFAIPGSGSHTIRPNSPLPPITRPLTIDGAQQPGIVLDGTAAGAGANGLVFAFAETSTEPSVLQGLEITGFLGNGILVSQPPGAGGLKIQANTIHGNAGAGVLVAGTPNPSQVSILSNSIYANGGLGIELNGDGVTANDVGDADAGANQRQNFPVLAVADGITITGTLNSTADTAFTLQFFASAAATASGYGDGQTYLGQLTNVKSDGSGNVSFSFPYTLIVGQPYITSTATDPLGNTSEFSASVMTTYSAKVSVARSSDGNGSEAGPNDGQFTVTLSAASSTATTVTYTLGGSATEGDDYAAIAVKNVTIAAGATTAVIDIDVTDDALVEATETVTVTLTDVTGDANITLNDAAKTASLDITDNDGPPTVTLAVDQATIAENAGVAKFTATLSNASTQAVTVDLGFTGTATLTNDYTRTGTQIVIAAGSLSGFVTVTAVPDTVFEGGETVVVDITGVTNGTESGTQTATTTIADDDRRRR